MTTPTSTPRYRISRYLASNPGQEIPASYNTSLGEKTASAYAFSNARRFGGKVVAELSDGEQRVVKDFSWVD